MSFKAKREMYSPEGCIAAIQSYCCTCCSVADESELCSITIFDSVPQTDFWQEVVRKSVDNLAAFFGNTEMLFRAAVEQATSIPVILPTCFDTDTEI